MKTMKLLAATSLLLSVSLSLTADVIRADRSDSQYLALGAQPQYESVGRLDITSRNGRFLGSGTLIASDWVLTAGHCLDKVKSLNFTVGGATYTADRWVANPGWKGNLNSGTDIGLLHLSQAVENVDPATLYAGSSELGTEGTFVGYGMTGTGITGATILDYQKRAAQNMLDSYLAGRKTVNTNVLLADFDNPKNSKDSKFGSSVPLDLEGLIAPGDSGGGLFIDVGGVTYLAGVHSFGAATDGKVDSDYGDYSGDTRVSAFNAWISSILGPAPISMNGTALTAGEGNTRAMNVFNAIPEPASLTLMALGGALMLLRRRSKMVA